MKWGCDEEVVRHFVFSCLLVNFLDTACRNRFVSAAQTWQSGVFFSDSTRHALQAF
jgi:hypothetical protein